MNSNELRRNHAASSDLENGVLRDGQERQSENTGSKASSIIGDLSLSWFTVSMNTGILSILMHQNPYQFDGLGVLSTIMFVFNLVLFTGMFSMLVLRVALYPRKFFQTLSSDITELSMLGAVPIAWFTLVAQVGLTVSQASWGGHAFTLVAYVMWWVGTAAMVFVAATVFIVVLKYSVTDTAGISPALVIPFVGAATNAVVGGLVVTYSGQVSAGIAIPVIIVSYLLAGLGFFMATIVFGVVMVRFLEHGMPDAMTPSLFFLIGPPGQSASAVLLLGEAARIYFPNYMEGTALTTMGGSAFSAIGVLLGLLFVGLAVYFLICALCIVLETGWRRQHSYSLLWWGTVFPVATVNTAWISLATAMNSTAFKMLSTIFLLALLVDYFVNWALTMYFLFTGRLSHLQKPGSPVTREKLQ